jgi:hypothetical protein
VKLVTIDFLELMNIYSPLLEGFAKKGKKIKARGSTDQPNPQTRPKYPIPAETFSLV